MEKFISVIIPIYKVEQYLERCIISVVHQSYRNLEIILVDDGSPDRCPAICDKWAERDPRIRVIHKENGGLSDARNAGLRYATGQWVMFVDSDDWISLNMAEDMLRAMREHDADLVICQFINVGLDGGMQKSFCCTEKVKIVNRREMFALQLENKEITNHVWRRLYKRNLITPDVFPQGQNYEDIAAMPLLIEPCEKIVLLDEAYYYYMINSKGIVCSKTGKNVLDHYDAVERAYAKIEELHPDLKKNIEDIKTAKALLIWKDMMEIQARSRKDMEKIKLGLRHWLKGKWPVLTKVLGIKDILFYCAIQSCIPLLDRVVYFILFSDASLVKHVLRSLKRIVPTIAVRHGNQLAVESPKFIVFCTPSYGNLGDRALEMGEQLFISKYFPEYRYCGILLEHAMSAIRHGRKYIRNEDLVAIQAGGNMGTLYPDIHRTQERVIKYLRKRGLCVFPQTYYYSSDDHGCKVLAETNKLYASCRNLKVFVRDNTSYQFLRENIPSGNAELMPDMALMLPEFAIEGVERKGAMICFRGDSEKTMELNVLDQILCYLEERFGHVLQSDTHVYHDDLPQEEAEREIESLLTRMASSEIVLTDRLHGMIFAALAKTPCIVIPSKSHKIEGVYDWIKENAYIRLLHRIEDLPALTEAVVCADRSRLERGRAQEQFARMAERIREQQGKHK